MKLIRQGISAWLKRIPKQDVICIIILSSAGIFTRLLLVLNTPFLYGQDAYYYLSEARDFASTGSIRFKEGMPFVFFLGAFLRIFGPLFGDINASRIFMILTSLILIIIIYFFGKKMSGRLLGLLAALLVTFEPYFLQWSTVPYREAFAISAGLLAVYFAISDKRFQNILSPILFYLAISTRAELFLALVIPMLISHFHKVLKTRSKGGRMTGSLASFFFAVFILFIIPFFAVYIYVQSWGAFGLVQRVALFLTPRLLSTTWELSFHFYDQQLLNQLITISVELVVALSLLNIFVQVKFEKNKNFPFSIQFRGFKGIKDAFFSEKGMTASSLLLLFVIYIIVLTTFTYGYNWAFYVSPSDLANVDILRRAVIIIPWLPERYLILLRLLISYPLAYPLAILARKVWSEFTP